MEPIRLTLLKKIKEIFEAYENPQTGKRQFSVVGIGALSDSDTRKQFAIGIVVGDEKMPHTTGTRDPILGVDIEFRQTLNKDEGEPGIAAEMLLATVQQIVMDNDTVEGMAISLLEVGNEIDIVTYSDKTIRGVVRCEMQYRQREGSVYTL